MRFILSLLLISSLSFADGDHQTQDTSTRAQAVDALPQSAKMLACKTKMAEKAIEALWKKFNISLNQSQTIVENCEYVKGQLFDGVEVTLRNPDISQESIFVHIPLVKDLDDQYKCVIDSKNLIAVGTPKDSESHLRKIVMKVGKYDVISIPHREMDKNIPIGSDATGTPKNLQGLFWMDGNPLADKIVSFAHSKFTDIKDKDGKVIGHQTSPLLVYDQGVWTWNDTKAGKFLYKLVNGVKLTYIGKFNADYTYGEVTPYITVIPGHESEVPPSVLVDFTMKKVGPDEFARDSILLGKQFTYRFRRVVDGDGNHLPAWDEFVKQMEGPGKKDGPPNGLIPVLRE